MFGPNDFEAVASGVGSALGKLPGLENAAELEYAKAALKAKGYLESVKRQGQGVVKRTPDGTWNNVWRGAEGLVKGIGAAHGAGLFGGGGGSEAVDILSNPNIGYDAGIGPGDFKFDWKSNTDMWNNPFSW